MGVIKEKVENQEELAQIEDDIFNAKVVLLNSKNSFEGKYPPLYLFASWDGKKSKYYPHFKYFVDNLDSILKHYKIAETVTDRNRIVSFGKNRMGDKLNALRGENDKGEPVTGQFSVGEENFDKWYVRLETEIMQNTDIDRSEAMGLIDELFDNTLKKFGYKAYHPLYRSAKLMIARIGEILVNGKVISINTLAQINNLIGRDYACNQIYKNLKDKPNSNPTTGPSENLRDDIITAATNKPGTEFTEDHATQIMNVVQDYIDEVQDFRKGRDVLKKWKNRPTYRKLLLARIIDKCDLLQKVGTLIDVSKLLFGGSKDYITSTFLNIADDKDTHKPHLETIFKILYNTNKWSVETFSQLGITTTNKELKEFKRVIYDEVKGWVYNAEGKENNWVQYISKTKKPYKRGAVATTELDFDLVFSVWQAAVIHEGNPNINFADMARLKLFKRSQQWDVNLRENTNFAPQAVRNILTTVKQWIDQESHINPDSDKLKYYFKLQAQVAEYAEKNDLNLMKLKFRTRKFNGRSFSYEYITAFHIIQNFGKHLGMDPLFFSSIEDEAYHLTRDKMNILRRLGEKVIRIIRHHFRDDPAGRDSFFASDIVTTDGSKHRSWETLSEAESLVIINGFEQLVQMKGSGSKMSGTSGINEITRADIEHVFKGNEWVYSRWYSDFKFTKNLAEFNDKRANIRTLRLNKFIQKYNPIAYGRFYENILKDKRPQLQLFLSELHPALDLSKVYKAAAGSPYLTQITRAFSELLRQYNHPIKI